MSLIQPVCMACLQNTVDLSNPKIIRGCKNALRKVCLRLAISYRNDIEQAQRSAFKIFKDYFKTSLQYSRLFFRLLEVEIYTSCTEPGLHIKYIQVLNQLAKPSASVDNAIYVCHTMKCTKISSR